MQLPVITNPILFWMSTHETYVNFAGVSNKVVSLIDRVNGIPVLQLVDADQPTWLYNGLAGGGAVVFTGSEFLQANVVGAEVSQKNFTLFLVSKSDDIAGSYTHALSVGNSAGNAYASVGFGSNTVELDTNNDANTGVVHTTADDGGVHVYTVVKDDSNFVLRRDGVVVATNAATGVYTFDSLTVGALGANAAVTSKFKGKMSNVLCYSGTVTDLHDVEQYLLVQAGLSTSEV